MDLICNFHVVSFASSLDSRSCLFGCFGVRRLLRNLELRLALACCKSSVNLAGFTYSETQIRRGYGIQRLPFVGYPHPLGMPVRDSAHLRLKEG